MMEVLRREWNKRAKERGIDPSQIGFRSKYGSKTIVDDVLLYAAHVQLLFAFFEVVLEVLQHHQVTIKLKKCKFLEKSLEFVGVDVSTDGNSPAQSKFAAFRSLPSPSTFSDLRMVIGMVGFYAQYLYLYEARIKLFRQLLTKGPTAAGMMTRSSNDISFLKQLARYVSYDDGYETCIQEVDPTDGT